MRSSRRTTDWGTVVLHAVLVVSFIVLTATGLRIATDDPDAPWLSVLDPVLPVRNLWYNHLVAGLVLAATLVAYAFYVLTARLGSRVQFDRARLVSMMRPGRPRWSALGVLVYWVLIGALATEVVTGVMLFAGAGRSTLAVHLNATFVCLLAVAAHVVVHYAYGGLGQLLRIARPAPLHIAEPPPDLAELLAEQLALNAGIEPGGTPRANIDPPTQGFRKSAPDTVRLHAHPFATAAAAALAMCGALAGAEQVTRPTLLVAEIAIREAPKLDGDLSDPVWTKAKPETVMTTQGGDFGGARQSLVEVRALHDGQYAYFAFVWEDPTRSLKHLPLVKRGGAWRVLATRSDLADEAIFHEDKFAVLLARPGLPLIGAAIHLARQPLSGAPPSTTGRGLHYTLDGSIADVWQWRASHGGTAGHIDNSHFGGPAASTEQGLDVASHYAGGFALDPGAVPYQANYAARPAATGAFAVKPRRLPRDVGAIAQAMGRISEAATESEAEGSRWWMTIGESQPYSAALDARIPDGAVIPGILVPDAGGEVAGSIRGVARWAAGRWTLELARRLHTGSAHDVPIKSGVLMWVAAFDHAEKRHTRHLRPFRLEVE